MKRRIHGGEERYVLFHAILRDAKLGLLKIGKVVSISTCDYHWNRDQVCLGLESLDVLLVSRERWFWRSWWRRFLPGCSFGGSTLLRLRGRLRQYRNSASDTNRAD